MTHAPASTLDQQTIHLWLLKVEETDLPTALLSPAELRRWQRFTRPAKRSELLHSRLLLRAALHHFAPGHTATTEAIPDDQGRPFWEQSGTRLPLWFSLSHTRGMAALAVAATPQIGCDLELIRPRRHEEALAAKVFSPQENALWHNARKKSNDAARALFYRTWTLKEALLKAMGIGLRRPLPSIDCASHLVDAPHYGSSAITVDSINWNLTSLPAAGCTLALATTSTTSRLQLQEKSINELLSLCNLH